MIQHQISSLISVLKSWMLLAKRTFRIRIDLLACQSDSYCSCMSAPHLPGRVAGIAACSSVVVELMYLIARILVQAVSCRAVALAMCRWRAAKQHLGLCRTGVQQINCSEIYYSKHQPSPATQGKVLNFVSKRAWKLCSRFQLLVR